MTSVDKYEFKLKVDEMKALVSARNYNAAAEIAETINWRKIRNLNALVLAGEVFEQVGRYEDSKEILLLAYDKSPIGRNIIYRLAEIAVKTKRFDEAQEYYDEFVDIAPHDNLKFVLKYKMTAAQGLPYKEQIRILEELKEQEYSEEWAYELAYLYHMDMQPEKCVEACDELILWFGDGIYVEKALELKMHYQPLSRPQEEKYRVFRQKRTGVIEVRPNDLPGSGEILHEAVEIPVVQTNTGQYNTANLQEEIAKGMHQISEAGTARKAFTQQTGQADQIQKIWHEPQIQPDYPMQRELYPDSQITESSYVEPQTRLDMYEENITQAEPEPAPAMTMEEIQAEWERTKQAMNDALQEAKEPRQETSKERSLEQAEQLMQKLLSMIPQLAEKMSQQELSDQPSVKMQNDLDQAGRIVAGINQLLQDQIDSLITGEEKQIPVIHTVSDPTQEMPHLPEHLLEGKEIGAVEKVEMNGNSLKKVSPKEDDNPVMSAWKEAPPGISALDLLQRVRMEKNAANAMGQTENMQKRDTLSDTMQQMQRTGTAVNRTDVRQQAQAGNTLTGPGMMQEENMEAITAYAENMEMESITAQAGRNKTALGTLQAENRNISPAAVQTEDMLAGSMAAQTEDRNMSPMAAQTENMEMGPITAQTKHTMMESDLQSPDTLMQQADLTAGAAFQRQVQHPFTESVIRKPDLTAGAAFQRQEQHPFTESVVRRPDLTAGAAFQRTEQNPMTESLIRQPNLTAGAAFQRQEQYPFTESVMHGPDLTAGAAFQQTQQQMAPDMEMQHTQLTAGAVFQRPEQSLTDTYIQEQTQHPENEAYETYGSQMQYEMDPDNMEQQLQNTMTGFGMEESQMFSEETLVNAGSSSSFEQEITAMETEDHTESSFEYKETEVPRHNISENYGRRTEPKFENEQENIFLAARPRFLTQAQLQAGSVMDGKKNAQITKEFSKEAVKAAHSAGFRENIPHADSQNMEEIKRLTPEQKQIFSYFVPITGMEAQIYDLLMGVSEHLQYDKHSQSGNIVIEGISGSGKTVLIMDIIKVLQKEIKRPVGKTGKIDANALNQKDLDVLLDKISGGCLIIESAGKISRETAVKLSRCMEKDHTGTLYILEDTEEGIQKAMDRDSSFAAKFTEKITIPLFSSDELVEFGKAYANDLNYDIDEMGVLALYKRISAIQKLDHVTTLTEVKEIVDEAIDNAEKGVLKKVFGMLTATRANDDNYIILREKDFEES